MRKVAVHARTIGRRIWIMAIRYRTRGIFLATLVAGLSTIAEPVRGQASNACDLNADGTVDVLDVQLATNMTLGTSPCSANVAGTNVCNIVVIQRVVNAALGGACLTGTVHSVSLSWTASTSTVVGYNVYRGTQSNGPYTKLNPAPVPVVSFTDNTVTAGQIYYYVTTAVDGNNNESGYSNQVSATIPTP